MGDLLKHLDYWIKKIRSSAKYLDTMELYTEVRGTEDRRNTFLDPLSPDCLTVRKKINFIRDELECLANEMDKEK